MGPNFVKTSPRGSRSFSKPSRAQVGPEQTFKNHQNRLKRGRGGSVWAQTLSKRRPEAQNHFPSPPGPKNLIQKIKNIEHVENPAFYRSKPSPPQSAGLGYRTANPPMNPSDSVCPSPPHAQGGGIIIPCRVHFMAPVRDPNSDFSSPLGKHCT